jgi:CHAD domain-containing protein
MPNAAADLVLAASRGRALQPVASLTTVRQPLEIRGEDGELLAEVVDDTVSVSRHQEPIGRFREIEVELRLPGNKGRRLLAAAVARLVDAGCEAEPPIPKLVRAVGESAARPPEVVVPPLGADATVIDLVRHATARSVTQILRYDPGARLGDDPEDVHKLRVATRRLRSDLHSFGPLLQASRVDPIRAELSWLGGVVGAVRDTDVLADRLADRLAALPETDAAGADRLQCVLDDERAAARAAMLTVLRDARYLALLDALVELAAAPPFVATPALSLRKSRKMASKIVQKPWQRVVAAVDELGDAPTDTELHQVRILAKRSRYAAEAAAPLLGPTAARFASAVADLQTVLGDHQDTVLAEAWLRETVADIPDGCETVNQLIELEQGQRAALRAEWPTVWRRASSKKLHSWR